MCPTDHTTDPATDSSDAADSTNAADPTDTAEEDDPADPTDTADEGDATPRDPAEGDPLVVPLSLPAEGRTVDVDLGGFERVTRTHRFRCTSGDRFGGEWTGVPVETALSSVSLPGDTTHLVVAGADGFQVCVPVLAALDGLFAIEESGADGDGAGSDGDGAGSAERASADGERRPDAPRFVSPGVDGPRTVQRVVRLEALHLDPGESADEYESI